MLPRTKRIILFKGQQGVTPPAVVTIAAPTMVTVVEPITNPPTFVWNVDEVPPGDVQAGDVCHVRIDEDGGQVYDSDPIAAPDENPTGFGVPELSAGLHNFEFWYSRPGVTGAKSAPLEVDVPSGAAWSPGDEAPGTFLLWLDGDDSGTIHLTSGNISQWDDKSGAGNHALQSSAGERPVPAVGGGAAFTLNDHFTCALPANNDDFGCFIVVEFSDLSANSTLLGPTSSNSRQFRAKSNGELALLRAGVEEEAESSGLALTTGVLYLLEVQADFGAATVFGKDGTAQTAGLHDTSFGAATTFIGQNFNTGEWLEGTVREILNTATTPSGPLATNIRNYLLDKWSI